MFYFIYANHEICETFNLPYIHDTHKQKNDINDDLKLTLLQQNNY